MDIKLIGLNARYTHSCLALFYIRNELHEHFPEAVVDIEQYTVNDPYYELFLRVTEDNPRYLFFSAAIWNSELLTRLIGDIGNSTAGIHCVVGGPQAEIVGKELQWKGVTVVSGEIERISARFYGDLRNGSPAEKYSCSGEERGFSLPYRNSDFSQHLQNRHVYYETSRGCPFSCTYCLSAKQRGVYHKELEVVKSELSFILDHNPVMVRFVDRTFNDNPKRALAIWQFLADCKGDTTFHFEVGPDGFNEEIFALLGTLPAGRFQFEMGIQSTHEKTLEAIRRPLPPSAARLVLSRLRAPENIHLHVDLILGLPYENGTSFLQSFKDVFSMGPHYIQMGLLKILPDTPICHSAVEYGYYYSSAPPYPVFATRWMGREEVGQFYWFSECVEKFINNRYFPSLWAYFRKTSIDIGAFFLDLLQLCRERSFFQQAATQERICSLLLECVDKRADKAVIGELLRYDWLRCGHRYLPGVLAVTEEESSASLKRQVFANQDLQGIEGFSREELSHYFKKGYFMEFSREAAQSLGFGDTLQRYICCFLPERENGLFDFSRVLLFTLPGGEKRRFSISFPHRQISERND